MENKDLFNFQNTYNNLNNKNVAKILGITEATCSRWKSGKSRIEDPKYIFGLKMIDQICTKLDKAIPKENKYYEYYFANLLRYRFNSNKFFTYPFFVSTSNVFFAIEFMKNIDKLDMSFKDLIIDNELDYLHYLTTNDSKQYIKDNKIYYFDVDLSYSDRKEIATNLNVESDSIINHINKNNEIIYSFPSNSYLNNIEESYKINSIIFCNIVTFLISIDDYEFIINLINSISDIDNFGLLYLYNHYISLDNYLQSKGVVLN